MNEIEFWIAAINLIVLNILCVVIPLVLIYYTLSKKKTPMWMLYVSLGTIGLFLLDYYLRREWDLGWAIPVQFMVLATLIFEQFVYRKEKEKDNDKQHL
jgi:multisubunit Na+/H+ antiporter MnhB subunit